MLKKCSCCLEHKELEDFYIHKKDSTTGRQSMCKSCSYVRRKEYHALNKEKYNKKSKEWTENNRGKIREYQLSKYGITQEQYFLMREQQNCRCAICLKHETEVARLNTKTGTEYALHVDHCHTTNIVRGLLCFKCNSMLGNIDDNVEALSRAMDYLNKERKMCS